MNRGTSRRRADGAAIKSTDRKRVVQNRAKQSRVFHPTCQPDFYCIFRRFSTKSSSIFFCLLYFSLLFYRKECSNFLLMPLLLLMLLDIQLANDLERQQFSYLTGKCTRISPSYRGIFSLNSSFSSNLLSMNVNFPKDFYVLHHSSLCSHS